jgi:hypothetical protein
MELTRRHGRAALCPGKANVLVQSWNPRQAGNFMKEHDKRILAILDQPPPGGYSNWTAPLLARELVDIHKQYIWRFRARGGDGPDHRSALQMPTAAAISRLHELHSQALQGKEIRVVIDNLSTHKPKRELWLARHPNVHFYILRRTPHGSTR